MTTRLAFRQGIGWIAVAAVMLATAGYLVWSRSQPAADIADYQGTQLDSSSSPDFHLLDHRGDLVSLSDFGGKVVALTFFDSKCVDVCPMISAYLRQANQMLGQEAEGVVFLAVNVNAQANSIADVAEATENWQLGDLTNWHFLTGSPAELEPVWGDYYIFADPTPGRQLVHTAGLFLIDREGRQRWYISTPYIPLGQGVLPPRTASISELLVSRIRELL